MNKNKGIHHYRNQVADIRNDLAISLRRKTHRYGPLVMDSLKLLITNLESVTIEAMHNQNVSESERGSLWFEVNVLLEQIKAARETLTSLMELQAKVPVLWEDYTTITFPDSDQLTNKKNRPIRGDKRLSTHFIVICLVGHLL